MCEATQSERARHGGTPGRQGCRVWEPPNGAGGNACHESLLQEDGHRSMGGVRQSEPFFHGAGGVVVKDTAGAGETVSTGLPACYAVLRYSAPRFVEAALLHGHQGAGKSVKVGGCA